MKENIDNLFFRNNQFTNKNIEFEKYMFLLNKKLPIKNVFN